MTRCHHVKKARKNYREHGIKKGEPYFWWKFQKSPKQYSKTRPPNSRLTRSPFWSEVYAIQEISSPSTKEDLESQVGEVKERIEALRDETQGNLDNMPQGLQDGDTGQLLAARIEACDEILGELDLVDLSFDIPDDDDGSAELEHADEVWTEVTETLSNISCD